MFSAGKILLTVTGALAALGIAAAPASATVLQTAGGTAYTGAFSATNVGNAVFSTSIGNVTCNQASLSGNIASAGSTGNPATGTVTASEFTNSNASACPDTIDIGGGAPTHEDFVQQGLPWTTSIDWVSDSQSGSLNGTVLLSGVTILADFDAVDCVYRGDFNNTGGTTNQVQADVYNFDNTPSGDLEIRLVSEPLETVTGGLCNGVQNATLTVTYAVQGAGAVDLQVENPAAPAPLICNDLSTTTPFETPKPISLSCTGGSGPVTYNMGTGPTNGAISGFDANTGALTYTPNTGFSGTDTFTYFASDAVGSTGLKTVTIEVGEAPVTPPDDTQTTPTTTTTSTTPTISTTPTTTPAAKPKAGKCGKAKKGMSAAKKKCKRKKK